MIDLRSEKSFIYHLVLPIIQILGFTFLLLSGLLNNRAEGISDILRIVSIVALSIALIILGIRELMVRKNKFHAYLCFSFTFVVIILIIYLHVIYRVLGIVE